MGGVGEECQESRAKSKQELGMAKISRGLKVKALVRTRAGMSGLDALS